MPMSGSIGDRVCCAREVASHWHVSGRLPEPADAQTCVPRNGVDGLHVRHRGPGGARPSRPRRLPRRTPPPASSGTRSLCPVTLIQSGSRRGARTAATTSRTRSGCSSVATAPWAWLAVGRADIELEHANPGRLNLSAPCPPQRRDHPGRYWRRRSCRARPPRDRARGTRPAIASNGWGVRPDRHAIVAAAGAPRPHVTGRPVLVEHHVLGAIELVFRRLHFVGRLHHDGAGPGGERPAHPVGVDQVLGRRRDERILQRDAADVRGQGVRHRLPQQQARQPQGHRRHERDDEQHDERDGDHRQRTEGDALDG